MNSNTKIDFDTRPLTFWDALFLLFLGLKLSNIITWSWIWVFAPIWIPVIINLIILIILLIFKRRVKISFKRFIK